MIVPDKDENGNIIQTSQSKVRDADDAGLVRLKQAPPGWVYELRCFEVETCSQGVFVNDDHNGNDRGGVTISHYDSNNLPIVDPNLLPSQCVKTVVDFEPEYDYEIIGGSAKICETPINDVRLWVVAVPDIPAPTGSKSMIGGANFKYFDSNTKVEADGRVSKMMKYDATYRTNKLSFIFKHNAGEKHKILIAIEHYKA